MDLGLQGKVAVVIGASEGIGYACAREFAREGCKIAICGRRADKLEKAIETLRGEGFEVFGYPVDATKYDEINAFAKAVYEHYGRIDAWQNNVGAQGKRAARKHTPEEIEYELSMNFRACLYGMEAAFEYIKKQGGAIINTASLAWRFPTADFATLYGPLKAAQVHLSNTLGAEYGAYGVRCIAVAPGFIMTPLSKVTLSEKPEMGEFSCKNAVLGRLGEPEELAKPVVFLASPAASFMTCTEVDVDGGRGKVMNPDISYKVRAELGD